MQMIAATIAPLVHRLNVLSDTNRSPCLFLLLDVIGIRGRRFSCPDCEVSHAVTIALIGSGAGLRAMSLHDRVVREAGWPAAAAQTVGTCGLG
jgi:hypothetical protein